MAKKLVLSSIKQEADVTIPTGNPRVAGFSTLFMADQMEMQLKQESNI
ncbi:MAG: hypothetical protein KBG10_07560 [Anaerolineaceae bacterium]|nr:hypothetical protein [Anaerolineaceae bacterium]